MAGSRKNRSKKRRRARPPQAAEPEAAKVEPASGRKEPRTRFGRWADRLEETADERPPAPWGNIPLGPLAVLAGLVFIVIGVIGGNPAQLAIGCGLGALGGLELSLREHFSGFRSHTTLLAGFTFVIVVGLTYFVATIVLWACLLIGLAVAIPTFWWLRRRFEKASGGLTYKLR